MEPDSKMIKTVLAALVISFITFWFGFYPTIATEEYVNSQIAQAIKVAPITSEANLRMTMLEKSLTKLEHKLDRIYNRLLGMEVRANRLLDQPDSTPAGS